MIKLKFVIYLPFDLLYLQQVGDLIHHLTTYSTQENKPCALPGKHSRVDPIDKGADESALGAWERHSWYRLFPLQCGGGSEGKMPSPISHHL